MSEIKTYPVPEAIKKNAHINNEQYLEMYQRSIDHPDEFWAEQAEVFVSWFRPWDKVQSGRWSVNGRGLRPRFSRNHPGRVHSFFRCGVDVQELVFLAHQNRHYIVAVTHLSAACYCMAATINNANVTPNRPTHSCRAVNDPAGEKGLLRKIVVQIPNMKTESLVGG